jgi:hypothetical protein
MLSAVQIAPICHAAIVAYQLECNDPNNPVSPPWQECSLEIRQSMINGVASVLGGSDAEDLHDSWSKEKFNQGWVWGPVKDFETKTHPCLVPWAALPEHERYKDILIYSMVLALANEAAM